MRVPFGPIDVEDAIAEELSKLVSKQVSLLVVLEVVGKYVLHARGACENDELRLAKNLKLKALLAIFDGAFVQEIVEAVNHLENQDRVPSEEVVSKSNETNKNPSS